jgi:hypothetical protein
VRKVNIIAAIVFICLIWSDLFNYLLAATPLVAWKQIAIVALWALTFIVDGANKFKNLAVVGLTVQSSLIIYSLFLGVQGEIAIYNSFLYLSWIPAFIVFQSGLLKYLKINFSPLWTPILIGSCVGLLVDLFTDAFSFVSRQGGEQITTSYLLENNIAKRVGFFFVTSTMVIPLMSSIAFLILDRKRTVTTSWMCAVAIAIGGLSTGSLSSTIVALLISVAFIAASPVKPSNVLLIMPLFLIITIGGLSNMSIDNFELQLERLSDNTNSDSEANIGRAVFWQQAISDIGSFTPLEHILGAGLGATNDNKGNYALYGHGESSFLQSYIECGLLGTISRLAPFIFLIYAAIRQRNLINGIWAASTFAAVALAPTYGNIPFQVVLGLMLARSTQIYAKDQVSHNFNVKHKTS